MPADLETMFCTNNAALGIVSDRYKVVQNEDAFGFTDSLLGAMVLAA